MKAAALLDKLAGLETDPGAKGYAEGMAERLRSQSRERVTDEYVDGLENAVADLGGSLD